MGKQTRSRKSENVIGKGKVTPVQVAFIVDRYLSDNNFLQTRSTFRNEASFLIAKSPVNEAPKSLLSLGNMLDEYICLKEQKVILNQEKNRLEQEKLRVQTLLRGMQDVMNSYNVGGAPPQPPPMVISAPVDPTMASPAANFPVYNTPVMMSTSTNFTTPTTSQPTLKRRKNSKDVSSVPSASKRSRNHPSFNQLKESGAAKSLIQQSNASNNKETGLQITAAPSSDHASAPIGSTAIQGSSVAKCLFNFNQSNHSPGPQTPSPSPIDKSTPMSPQKFTSTVITSETIKVSPSKQISYYSIERSHCISSPMKTDSKRFNKRDHVKGRLDFDGSDLVANNSEISTSDGNTESPSGKEDYPFDFDLPSLDCFGADFNFTELLGDFDLDGQQMDYFCQPATGSSPESLSGSPETPANGHTGGHELLSGMSSTLTEIQSQQDMDMSGPNSVTSMKSVTKCIKVFSPAKNRKSIDPDHQTTSVRD